MGRFNVSIFEVLTAFYELWSYARSSIKRFNKNYDTFRILHTHDNRFVRFFLSSFFLHVIFFFHLLFRRHLISSLCVSETFTETEKRRQKLDWLKHWNHIWFWSNEERKIQSMDFVSFSLGFAYWMMDFDYGFQYRVLRCYIYWLNRDLITLLLQNWNQCYCF